MTPRQDEGGARGSDVTLESTMQSATEVPVEASASEAIDTASPAVPFDAATPLTCSAPISSQGANWDASANEPPIDTCGDAVVDSNEQCDDGNEADADGCDHCVVEPNWRCDPGMPCESLLLDRPCSDGCFASETCIERGVGVTCACADVLPADCAEIYYRSFVNLGDRLSCSPRALSGDGTTLVGSCVEGADPQDFPVAWRDGELPERLAEEGRAVAVNFDGSLIVLFQLASPPVLWPSGEFVDESAPLGWVWAMNAAGDRMVGDGFALGPAGLVESSRGGTDRARRAVRRLGTAQRRGRLRGRSIRCRLSPVPRHPTSLRNARSPRSHSVSGR